MSVAQTVPPRAANLFDERLQRTMRQIVRATVSLTVCISAAGCAPPVSQGAGAIAAGATPVAYRYVVVSPASSVIAAVAGAFVEKGYIVLRPEAVETMSTMTVPPGAVLMVSCTYLGHASKLVESGGVVSCEAIDYASRKPVYTGTGKFMSWTGADYANAAGAVRNAVQDLPYTGRIGSISMSVDLGPATQPTHASVQNGQPRPQPASSGTGLFVDSIGDVVTNAHVIDSCASVVAKGVALRVLYVDRRNDLALLRHPRGGESLLLRDGRSVRPGDPIVVLGFPLAGLVTTQAIVTTGTVSALGGLGDDTRFIQMSAPVQPGSSGGPCSTTAGWLLEWSSRS